MPITTTGAGKYASSATYTGPGDLSGLSGASAFWALRAYGSAQCTGSVKAIRIVKTSDGSAAQDINILTSGSLDIATIAGLGYGVSVTKIYDQSGNGHDLSQATLANMPTLTLAGLGSFDIMAFARASNQTLGSMVGTITASQPFSFSSVITRTGNTTATQTVLRSQGVNLQYGFNSAVNQVFCFAGALPVETCNDNTWHSYTGIFNGTSSAFYINGATNGVVNFGTTGITADTIILGGFDATTNVFDGNLTEVIIYPSDISSNAAALSTNQRGYWGI